MDPFTGSDNRKAFERLVRNIDQSSRLLRAWDLKGGVSAQVTALEIERPDGTTERVVVRRHGRAHLKSNPNAAADEFRLLEVLHAAGLPVPAPIYVDQSGKSVASPCVVIAYIDGASEFAPASLPTFVHHLATILASIHAVDVSTVSFLPEQAEWTAAEFHARLPELADGGDSTGIEQAIASTAAHAENRPVLLHGDFWPGNILWKDGHLAAIIDWEDARLGDPLSDISGARLELLWAFGAEAMEQFTEDYTSLTDIDPARLPYWDLRVAIGPAATYATWTDDAVTVQRMRERRRWFIAQALDNLVIRPVGQMAGSTEPQEEG
jgi:aminoglycoside phosphotransferase (APT) family kinase protein